MRASDIGRKRSAKVIELEAVIESHRAMPSDLLDVHAICDQRDKFEAKVSELERELAAARAATDRLRGALEEYAYIPPHAIHGGIGNLNDWQLHVARLGPEAAKRALAEGEA